MAAVLIGIFEVWIFDNAKAAYSHIMLTTKGSAPPKTVFVSIDDETSKEETGTSHIRYFFSSDVDECSTKTFKTIQTSCFSKNMLSRLQANIPDWISTLYWLQGAQSVHDIGLKFDVAVNNFGRGGSYIGYNVSDFDGHRTIQRAKYKNFTNDQFGALCGDELLAPKDDLISGSISRNTGGLISFRKKAGLIDAHAAEDGSEGNKAECKERYGIVRCPLPEGFAAVALILWLTVFVATLGLLWLIGRRWR